jgi:hypothetical protein
MKKKTTAKKSEGKRVSFDERVEVVVKKEKEESCVTDLFDVTDEEWEVIIDNASKAQKECENMEQIARRLGIIGGGPLAVNAFLFGRMVESNESKRGSRSGASFKSLMDTLEIVQKVKNDEKISDEERVTLLRNLAKLLEERVKK